jgi:hypothetical protein
LEVDDVSAPGGATFELTAWNAFDCPMVQQENINVIFKSGSTTSDF